MKLKLDENISRSTQSRLAALGFDVDTVLEESLGGHPDAQVWAAAQAEGRLLITQDLDFSDARKFSPGSHHGLVLVRLPDSEQWRLADYVVAWFSSAEAKTWEGCFVVATPNKVRVLRPSKKNRS
jgi:predicted nuclease of predicted toxin-antitoxin system